MSDADSTTRRTTAAFTLMTAGLVVAVLAALFVVLMPQVLSSPGTANCMVDEMQLRTHFEWLRLYRMTHEKRPPGAGGCRFVLASWTSGIPDHTVENFDKYFTPGARDDDANYLRMRDLVLQGKDPWPELQRVTSADTHYVGRAQEYLVTTFANPGEALMATDNECGWRFPDGTINILFADGEVRALSYAELQARFGLGKLDRDAPIKTWGQDSPIPECRKLANE